ncbi:hypothetical protein [Dictyobacter arantiisoli]|uniref:hypothetical protein n=1 Tax=Dictyobacter arantiisoli TaxID=2014874 RepID=UPI00155B20BE|nr:hypothetical protein [Dictyobacter arantiisoli]
MTIRQVATKEISKKDRSGKDPFTATILFTKYLIPITIGILLLTHWQALARLRPF